MSFTDSELSTIAVALQQYSFQLTEEVGRQKDESLRLLAESERRVVWDLRTRLNIYFKSQPSSAEGQ